MDENSLPPRQKIWVVSLSVFVLGLTLDLVRRRKVREEDSWLWLAVGIITFILGTQYRALQRISNLLGIVVPTSTIFFFGQLFLMMLAMQTSMRFADLSRSLHQLIQEVAIYQSEDRNVENVEDGQNGQNWEKGRTRRKG